MWCKASRLVMVTLFVAKWLFANFEFRLRILTAKVVENCGIYFIYFFLGTMPHFRILENSSDIIWIYSAKARVISKYGFAIDLFIFTLYFLLVYYCLNKKNAAYDSFA